MELSLPYYWLEKNENEGSAHIARTYPTLSGSVTLCKMMVPNMRRWLKPGEPSRPVCSICHKAYVNKFTERSAA